MHWGKEWQLPLLPGPIDVRLVAAILESVTEKSEASADEQYALARNVERSLAYLCCAVESGFLQEVNTVLTVHDYSVHVYLPKSVSDNS